MFESARIQLTAWYVLLIMFISGLFSIAFYHSSTREIQRLIDRIEATQQLENPELPLRMPMMRFRNAPSLEELRDLKQRSLFSLVMVNGGIFVVSSFAAYFLAGRTLRPIKVMIDEQNEFISNASHELRTPLSTLRAEMEGSLLEKRITDSHARQLIQSNLEEVGTLQELTNNLLRLTQTHSFNGKKERKPIAIAEVIKAAHKKVAALAKQKQISITTEAPERRVLANSGELTEAFVVLLDNAIKYSQKKSVVKIQGKTTDHTLLLSVIDQGVGISEDDLPHIFHRFYRADKSRSHADGYGLGLSIAQKIIEDHGGKISVTSEVGEGSTFTVQLPVS